MEKETPEENLNQACVRVLKEMTKETLDQAQQKYCPYHGKKVPCGACQDLMDKTYKETPECCTDTCGKERPNWLGRIPITPDPETPEHDKYNCEECRENMREYTKETPKIGDDPTAFSTPTAPGVIITTAGTSSPETPTEEWEREFDSRFTNPRFPSHQDESIKSFIRSLITSHDAELRRKIEGMLPVAGVRNGAWLIEEDAVLALLGKKNV